MKLRGKTLLIIGATLFGMVGLLYAASSAIFLKAIAKAEEQSNRQTVQGVLHVVTQTQAEFNDRFADWSAWDDTYTFVVDRNPDYMASNLVPGTLKSLRVNLVVFVDASGQLVYGTGFDATTEQLTPLPDVVRRQLVPDDRLLQHPDPSSRLAGIWVLPEGAMLITSQPIVTSAGQGPIRGTLIMGRKLDVAEVDRLAAITGLPLALHRIHSIHQPTLPPDVQAARTELFEQVSSEQVSSKQESFEQTPFVFHALNQHQMAGYTLLKDIYDQPALLLRVEIPREIYQQGQSSLRYLVIAVVLTGLIFGGVTLLLLERLVLTRLTRLSANVRQIGESGHFSDRVHPIAGTDELPMLANDVNTMLEALEHSQRQVIRLNQRMLAEVQQEKTDLEIILSATTEHSDTIASELEQQVAEERRQKEEQFQLITEATPVAILIAQLTHGQILYANQAAGTMLGVAAPELLNYRALDFYHNPADRQQILPLLSSGQRFQGEVRFKRADGTPFWAFLSLRPFRFQGTETLLSALYDITDRKHAEEALRLAEANYRSIFENALDGIYQTTPRGQYARVNSAMAKILGYDSPADMIATVSDVSQEYVEEADRQEFQQLMAQQGGVSGFERRMYCKDGQVIWVSESARSVWDEQGTLLYYEGIIEDITQRKLEAERLKQQVQALQIEIDQAKRDKQVAEIAQTDYFQYLLQEADNLRFSEER